MSSRSKDCLAEATGRKSGIPDSTSAREEADNYRRIVAILNEDWRIIECRDGIQWILQHRSGKRHGQPRWVSKKFNRCKAALLANVHGLVGEMEPAVWTIICSLPDWFGGEAMKPQQMNQAIIYHSHRLKGVL